MAAKYSSTNESHYANDQQCKLMNADLENAEFKIL